MSRAHLAGLVVLALVVAAPLALLTDDDGRTEPRAVRATLGWDGEPRLMGVPELPSDQILSGRLANESLRPTDLDVERVRILDGDGRVLRSTARFASSFAHGLFSAESINLYGKPGDGERRRLGEIATVKPRESVPVTLSWRIAPGGGEAETVDFGGARVALP